MDPPGIYGSAEGTSLLMVNTGNGQLCKQAGGVDIGRERAQCSCGGT